MVSYQYKLTVDSVVEMMRGSLILPSVYEASSIISSVTMVTTVTEQTFRYSLNLFMKEMKNSAFLMLPGMASIVSNNVNHLMMYSTTSHCIS